MSSTTHLTFRYMLGGAEPVQLYAHTCQEALENAAQHPGIRGAIGRTAAPRFADLQVLHNGEWNWVLGKSSNEE